MQVIAAKDPVPVVPEPVDGSAPRFIQPEPAEPVEVVNSSYYKRRILSGELLVISDASQEATTKLVRRASAKPIAKEGEK